MNISEILKTLDTYEKSLFLKAGCSLTGESIHIFRYGSIVTIDCNKQYLIFDENYIYKSGSLSKSEYGFVVDKDTYFSGSTMYDYYGFTLEDFERMRSLYKK